MSSSPFGTGGPLEVLLTSDEGGEQFNVSAWDSASGAQVKTWKGGTSAARTVDLLGGEYLLSACRGKPMLNVWRVDRREQVRGGPGLIFFWFENLKLFCPHISRYSRYHTDF